MVRVHLDHIVTQTCSCTVVPTKHARTSRAPTADMPLIAVDVAGRRMDGGVRAGNRNMQGGIAQKRDEPRVLMAAGVGIALILMI